MFLYCFVFIMFALRLSFMLYHLQFSMTAGKILRRSNAELMLTLFFVLRRSKYFEIVGRTSSLL